jgi:hypothetical protein
MDFGGHARRDLSFAPAATIFNKHVVDYHAGAFSR